MKLNVLISCMYEKDTDIITRSNIQTDVVVINQCDKDSIIEFDFKNKKGEICHAKFINTTERGLSRSRNMAIRNAWGDICLICDDDEYLANDYEHLILDAYSRHPECEVIAFALNREDYNKLYSDVESRMYFQTILKTSSPQISFRKGSIIQFNISFNEKMGSGTGNGVSEENTFLMDCRRAGFNLHYVPAVIATIKPGKSQWFNGFTKEYFFKQGWAQKKVFKSTLVALLYLIVFDLKHSSSVFSEVSRFNAFRLQIKGLFLSQEPSSYLQNHIL